MSTRVIIIGAGFGGLGAAKALREQGVEDITILERADTVGGVWRDNTYPGAACDVPVPALLVVLGDQPGLGSALLAAAGDPRLPPRPPLSARGCSTSSAPASRSPRAASTRTSSTWRLLDTNGTAYEAEVVVSAVGQLSNPVVPSIKGVETFAGPAFHSAEWRHDVDLVGKRVAVVGTGASAIQFVPGIVDEVGSMTVFQRSAPYVVPKPDQEYRPSHHRAFERFPRLLTVERRSTFWLTERLNSALGGVSPISKPLLATMRAAWKLQLRRQVPDAALRAKLQPDYEIGCKRILFSNDWYPALARDHVEVVTGPVSAIEPAGVRTADGELHEVDVLIWGTGFAATSFLSPMAVTGEAGVDLHEVWSDGARAHLGVSTPGFPNLFLIYGPNTNLGGSSIIGMMEAQAGYIARWSGGSPTEARRWWLRALRWPRRTTRRCSRDSARRRGQGATAGTSTVPGSPPTGPALWASINNAFPLSTGESSRCGHERSRRRPGPRP